MADVKAQQSKLDEDAFIRGKLFDGDKSTMRRYADLVVGERGSYRDLFVYELITMLFGRLSGALGLALRKIFYPRLFKRCGRGVVFGRDLVIRNAQKIELGDQVILDDGCVLDGRGAGEAGVVIGDRVILGRGVMLQAKIGPVHIGADSDIGAMCMVLSQGGTWIGREVVLGGACKVSGGGFKIEREAVEGESGQAARGQTRQSSGPVRIGDRVIAGMSCMFLDGVDVGEASVVGAGSVVTRSLPAGSVAAGMPAKVLRARDEQPARTSAERPLAAGSEAT